MKQQNDPAEPPEEWQKSPVPNLIRYVPSGIYFARVRVGGKLIRRSLGCTKLSVAQLRLADFIKEQRTQLEIRQTAEAGQLTFGQAEDIYRERLKLNHKLKPSSKEYRLKTLFYLHGTWPGLADLDLARISAQDCTAWAVRFKKADYSATVFNNTLGTLRAIFAIALEAGVRYGNPAAGITRMPIRSKRLVLPDRKQFLQLVNTIYGRWWHPLDEKPGPNPVANSPLPWTGEFKDGLGNPIRMLAYANPEDIQDEKKRADGYGLIRFDRKSRKITFECWPRFAKVADGNKAQFPGWPVTITQDANDGRKVHAQLPAVKLDGVANPVVQVIAEATSEILYTVRAQTPNFAPRVYAPGKYTVKAGKDKPDTVVSRGFEVM